MTSISNISSPLRRVWHPIGRPESFTHEPTRFELVGDGYVAVRLADEIRVFRDMCPHRFARLSDGCVVDDTIQCPYHGWQFSAEGRCVHVPAMGDDATPPPARLTAPHVMVRYGLVWVAPEDPVADPISIPRWDDASLEKVWIDPVDVKAGAAQIVDNFLDFAHFPYVHAGTFGSDKDRLVHDYTTERTADGWGFVVDYPHVIENHEDPLVATGEHPLVQPREMKYQFQVPFSANLQLFLPTTGMVNHILLLCQPMTLDTTRVHMVMLRNDCPDDASKLAAVAYELRVFDEDLKILERLPDTSIPLERGQVHVRSDRHTVEFRRILERLVTL
ncbi:MAG: Rieske 2Fe-2S domain-containing protein [Ilumatobacteraceae bacterium]